MPAVAVADVAGSAQATRKLRDLVIVGVLVAFALLALYATLLDQGALLLPLLGDSPQVAYLHELMHDGRHTVGAPCH